MKVIEYSEVSKKIREMMRINKEYRGGIKDNRDSNAV